MRKGILLAGLVVSSLLVTGCGDSGKTLNCTLKEEAGGATTTSVMDMKFNKAGDQVDNVTMEIVIDYTKEYESFANVFKQTLETQKTNLEKIGYEVEITSGNNSQKLTAKGTSETLDKSESTGTYKDTKKSLEDAGYTCK